MKLPRVVISAGEPAGIGPDISLLCAQKNFHADIITIGDPELFRQRAEQLQLAIKITKIELEDERSTTAAGTLKVLPISLAKPCIPGQLDRANAPYVLNVLDQGIAACLNNQADALVTGPIQKSILNSIVKNFSGHTEYLAEQTDAPLPVMMLATKGLRVALVTTHMPLRKVAENITSTSVQQTLEILHHDLQHQFGILNPKILIAGLNPHAGEDGHLGTEDMEIITPVIEKCKKLGMKLQGPLPADTLFTEKYLADADAVLTMYHDQGLPVLKYKGFGNAINVTLGLPIIRTSVDHGTALDLAGTGQADEKSLLLAIQTALEITKSRH